ncbi:MAG: hypothetical protein K2O14_08230 [Oscillospiraceae bacterium]|nr:hypothetical protein [Oscillospiraceae bacterium]
MNAENILNTLEDIEDAYIAEARSGRASNKSVMRIALIAAAAAALLLCGFAAYEAGFVDRWLQKPSADPVETVRSAIENQAEKDYTITVRVEEISTDAEETDRARERYMNSELARERGWSEELLSSRFAAVRAKYYVEYDHTQTFMDDGYTEQYFYLIEDNGSWVIVENTSPRIEEN